VSTNDLAYPPFFQVSKCVLFLCKTGCDRIGLLFAPCKASQTSPYDRSESQLPRLFHWLLLFSNLNSLIGFLFSFFLEIYFTRAFFRRLFSSVFLSTALFIWPILFPPQMARSFFPCHIFFPNCIISPCVDDVPSVVVFFPTALFHPFCYVVVTATTIIPPFYGHFFFYSLY